MISIGELARRTGVKVPTIRYYEQVGLIGEPGRTAGNQRRYGAEHEAQARFVRHARELGFPLSDISALLALQRHPDRSCAEATEIARHQLEAVRGRLRRLAALEQELERITGSCNGECAVAECDVLAAVADHGSRRSDHSAPDPLTPDARFHI